MHMQTYKHYIKPAEHVFLTLLRSLLSRIKKLHTLSFFKLSTGHTLQMEPRIYEVVKIAVTIPFNKVDENTLTEF